MRLSGAGPCSWGKEKTAREYGHEQESNGKLLWSSSHLAKKGSSDLPIHFALEYRSAAAQTLVLAGARGLSLLAVFPLSLFEFSWGVLGGLMLFL